MLSLNVNRIVFYFPTPIYTYNIYIMTCDNVFIHHTLPTWVNKINYITPLPTVNPFTDLLSMW